MGVTIKVGDLEFRDIEVDPCPKCGGWDVRLKYENLSLYEHPQLKCNYCGYESSLRSAKYELSLLRYWGESG